MYAPTNAKVSLASRVARFSAASPTLHEGQSSPTERNVAEYPLVECPIRYIRIVKAATAAFAHFLFLIIGFFRNLMLSGVISTNSSSATYSRA